MTLLQRIKSPTPKFFNRLKIIGLGLAAAGGAILTAPVALPVLLTTIGGYLITAGSVVTAISQFAVKREK